MKEGVTPMLPIAPITTIRFTSGDRQYTPYATPVEPGLFRRLSGALMNLVPHTLKTPPPRTVEPAHRLNVYTDYDFLPYYLGETVGPDYGWWA